MYPWENTRSPMEGRELGRQVLEVISGEISGITLMRYKTNHALKPLIKELVPAQESGSQVGQPGME